MLLQNSKLWVKVNRGSVKLCGQSETEIVALTNISPSEYQLEKKDGTHGLWIEAGLHQTSLKQTLSDRSI